jgi:hypothetical protein
MRASRRCSVLLSFLATSTSLLAVCLVPSQAVDAHGGQQGEPATAAEMSKKETVASAFLRGLQYQEYEVRSAAEATPEEKYGYRPAEGKFGNEKPEFGPAQVGTFAQQ